MIIFAVLNALNIANTTRRSSDIYHCFYSDYVLLNNCQQPAGAALSRVAMRTDYILQLITVKQTHEMIILNWITNWITNLITCGNEKYSNRVSQLSEGSWKYKTVCFEKLIS